MWIIHIVHAFASALRNNAAAFRLWRIMNMPAISLVCVILPWLLNCGATEREVGVATGGMGGGVGGAASGAGGVDSAGGGVSGAPATSGGAGGDPCTVAGSRCVIDFAGKWGEPGLQGGTLETARFRKLAGITGHAGKLYVSQEFAISEIDMKSGMVRVVAGSTEAGLQNGIGVAARFNSPRGLAVHDNTLLVVDSGVHAVRAINLSNDEVTPLAGNVGTPNPMTGFNFPTGITIIGSGSAAKPYVADTMHNAIRTFVFDMGKALTVSGNQYDGGFASGTLLEARYNLPTGITTDGALLYVTDTANHRVVRLNLLADSAETLAGDGSSGFDDKRFNRPTGITVSAGGLFVADSKNLAIRHVALDGTISTLAGAPDRGEHLNGPAPEAGFTELTDLYFDAESGDLFVLDDHVIRRIDL
jgi:hypothetical protein